MNVREATVVLVEEMERRLLLSMLVGDVMYDESEALR